MNIISFVLSAQFIVGLILGGAGMFIYSHWPKKK